MVLQETLRMGWTKCNKRPKMKELDINIPNVFNIYRKKQCYCN